MVCLENTAKEACEGRGHTSTLFLTTAFCAHLWPQSQDLKNTFLNGWMNSWMNAWQASAHSWDRAQEALASSPLEEFGAEVVWRPCWLPSLKGWVRPLVPWLEPPSSLIGLLE